MNHSPSLFLSLIIFLKYLKYLDQFPDLSINLSTIVWPYYIRLQKETDMILNLVVPITTRPFYDDYWV